jgi:hypothetical protein
MIESTRVPYTEYPVPKLLLLNKQLFSSLKIRWMKCWARKSPTHVKNLGNIQQIVRKTGQQKIRGNFLYTGLTRNLTSRESRAVLFSSMTVIIMEFPPESYDVFDAEQFETARARLAGDAVMEVMLQMRPNGRCLDHYRIACWKHRLTPRAFSARQSSPSTGSPIRRGLATSRCKAPGIRG